MRLKLTEPNKGICLFTKGKGCNIVMRDFILVKERPETVYSSNCRVVLGNCLVPKSWLGKRVRLYMEVLE